jgi:hypothetical protein
MRPPEGPVSKKAGARVPDFRFSKSGKQEDMGPLDCCVSQRPARSPSDLKMVSAKVDKLQIFARVILKLTW